MKKIEVSQSRKKLKGFFNIHSVAKLKKNEGGPFEEKKSRKKVSQCRKNLIGDPLASSGIVCYAGNLCLRFSSLGQRVQFGVFLKFCRTILVTSGDLQKKH